MLRYLFSFTLLGWMSVVQSLAQSVAQAEMMQPRIMTMSDAKSLWDVTTIELTQVDESIKPAVVGDRDCGRTPNELGGVDWSTIVTVGEKIWQIVEANKPVVNVQTQVVHALPSGLKCWTDLEHWKAPHVDTYQVVYKNGFGMEVVKFRFRLQFTFGGGQGTRGQYLANVTVLPAELNVLWAYNFDAKVEANPAVNLGSLDNPLAGLELNLQWTVKTVLQESKNSIQFFVQGDGVSKSVN